MNICYDFHYIFSLKWKYATIFITYFHLSEHMLWFPIHIFTFHFSFVEMYFRFLLRLSIRCRETLFVWHGMALHYEKFFLIWFSWRILNNIRPPGWSIGSSDMGTSRKNQIYEKENKHIIWNIQLYTLQFYLENIWKLYHVSKGMLFFAFLYVFILKQQFTYI